MQTTAQQRIRQLLPGFCHEGVLCVSKIIEDKRRMTNKDGRDYAIKRRPIVCMSQPTVLRAVKPAKQS